MTTTGESLKPGYFWLAASWSNLLPSCIDCNRERRHTDRDGEVRTFGKGNRFPLADESQRVRTAGASVSGERPLLLNPYRDNPEEHLDFANSGAVRPSRDASRPDREDRRGRTTIDIAGLNRPALVRARRDHVTRVRMQIARVADAENSLRRYPRDSAFLDQLRRELGQLRQLKAARSPYLTLTEQMIDTHRSQLAGT